MAAVTSVPVAVAVAMSALRCAEKRQLQRWRLQLLHGLSGLREVVGLGGKVAGVLVLARDVEWGCRGLLTAGRSC